MVDHLSEEEVKKLGEEYNRIFTVFQKLDKKLANWEPLSAKTKDKWEKILAQQQITALSVQNQLLKQQIAETKNYTKWFIRLTITIIVLTVITTVITIAIQLGWKPFS
jgi:hypothetical protein